MLNDTISTMLSKIQNYEGLGRKECLLSPVSTLGLNILTILHHKGYIGASEKLTDARGSVVKTYLLGKINKCGVIKPRFSVQLDEFEKFEKRYLPAHGVGIIIISTNNGLMTLDEAQQKRIGGRLIAYCY